MSYESDIASGRFVPSQKALEADAFIASTSPETHPDKYTFLGTMGWVYTGPERFDTSLTEHTGWVNRNLGSSGFGGRAGSFKDVYDDPDPQPPVDDTPDNSDEMDPRPVCNEVGAINFGEVGECLNRYGDPFGTVYAGGPCFDETTGTYDRSKMGCEDSPPDPPPDGTVPEAPTNGTTTGAPPFVNIGSPVGGAFTGMAPQGLSYSATALPSTAPAPSVKNVDYVKLLRGWLTNSLFKDMI